MSNQKEERTRVAAEYFRKRTEEWQTYAATLKVKVQRLERKLLDAQGRSRNSSVETSVQKPNAEALAAGDNRGETPATTRRPTFATSLSPHSDIHKPSLPPDVEPDACIKQCYERVGEAQETPGRTSAQPRPQPPSFDRKSTAGDTSSGHPEEPDLPPLSRLAQAQPGSASVKIKAEPSSDVPVIVWEKCLKRKRDDQVESPTVRRLKTETSSDAPVMVELSRFDPCESLDLDPNSSQIEVQTPRKNRLGGTMSPKVNVASDLDLPAADPVNLEFKMPKPKKALVTYGGRVKKSSEDMREGLEVLAEDGQLMPGSSTVPLGDGQASAMLPTDGRLNMLLNHPTPERRTRLRRSNAEHPNHQTRGSVPLRQRPVESLRLGDFKAAKGKFAYNEVVRKKADRAALEGCTDSNCCGKYFRPSAESELRLGGPSMLLQSANIKLMEDYLGYEAFKLGMMTRSEKEEVWLQAKTRDLANKVGRHRDRFDRRQSPPGYWDADMPSTQQLEKQKEEAEKQERALIEHRRREATRPGGKWVFRDE